MSAADWVNGRSKGGRKEKFPKLREPQPGEPAQYVTTGYHTTTPEVWKSIQRFGLTHRKAQAPPGQSWKGTYSGKGTYFHQELPKHEIRDSYDKDTGEPIMITVEAKLNHGAGYIVPDEEAGDPKDTPQIMRDKGPIAIGYPTPPGNLPRVHLADTPAARQWAKDNLSKKHEAVFHDVGWDESKHPRDAQGHFV
jgi:hypothetical protein